jgi:hypothetical protein
MRLFREMVYGNVISQNLREFYRRRRRLLCSLFPILRRLRTLLLFSREHPINIKGSKTNRDTIS